MARDGETIVFVEVKARATAEFGTAAEAVTPRKQRRVVSMAVDYLARQRADGSCPAGSTWWRSTGVGDRRVITVYPDAFDVSTARTVALA